MTQLLMNRPWLQQELTRKQGWYHRVELATLYSEQVDSLNLDRAIDSGNKLFKHDRTTSVAKFDTSKQSLIVKRYNARSFWHRIKRALRRSRAHRVWSMSYRFSAAGLNVAQPIMLYEQRFGPIRGTAYFVSEFLPGEELLTLLPSMSVEQQHTVVTAIDRAFVIMREHRLSHGDMKASNLLWVDGQLFFIDLDAARQYWISFRWQAAHRRDKKRFLKNWRDNPPLSQLFANL